MADQENDKRISRRDVMRRGAVVGGLVWSAPIVQSLTRPASAAITESPPQHVCCFCSSPRSRRQPPAQCFADGFPPDAATCATLCDDLGYNSSSWTPGPAAFSCDTNPQSPTFGCIAGTRQ